MNRTHWCFFFFWLGIPQSDKGTLCIYNFRPSTYVLVLVLAFPFGLVKLVQCLSWSWLCLLDWSSSCDACFGLGYAFWTDQARVMLVLSLIMPFRLIKFVWCLSWTWLCLLDWPSSCDACLVLSHAIWIDQARVMLVLVLTIMSWCVVPFGPIKLIWCLSWDPELIFCIIFFNFFLS